MAVHPCCSGRRVRTQDGVTDSSSGFAHAGSSTRHCSSCSGRTLLTWAVVSTGLLLLSAAASSALADTQVAFASIRIGGAPAEPAWEPAVGLLLTVADTLDPAGLIFDSPDFQRQLVVPGNGEEAFLLDLAAHAVLSLPRDSIVWSDEKLPVPDLAEALDIGGFLVDEGVVAFHVDGIELAVKPEPPLVGEVSLERLHTSKPDYVHTAGRYRPDPKVVEAVRGVGIPTEVAVFFGTWCVTCKQYLPEFMKIMEEADNPNIQVVYYGVSEDQLEPKEALKKYRNSATPAFIVLQGGREIGRIEHDPLDSIGLDLAHILGVRP